MNQHSSCHRLVQATNVSISQDALHAASLFAFEQKRKKTKESNIDISW